MDFCSSFLFTSIPKKKVNVKLIQCGDCIQVYIFDKSYYVNEKGFEKIEDSLILKENYIENYDKKIELKEIEERNVIRSKNNLCRLVLANEKDFKSFVTLTFGDEIFDISVANYEFHKFITKMKKTFNEFLYVGVPEFQKNGRVHYHLLTNLEYNDKFLINENIATNKLFENKTEVEINELVNKFNEKELLKKYNKNELNNLPVVFRNIDGELINCKRTYNKKSKTYENFKTLKYWNCGFNSIKPLNNINIVGYMSKYMTKDIDNRLFSKKRYFFSNNLKKPTISYLNLENSKDLEFYNNLLALNSINYTNDYFDKFGNKIEFIELNLKI